MRSSASRWARPDRSRGGGQRADLRVVPLPEAEFYHFGANGQMIESVSALQNLVLDEAKLGARRAAAAGPSDAELAL